MVLRTFKSCLCCILVCRLVWILFGVSTNISQLVDYKYCKKKLAGHSFILVWTRLHEQTNFILFLKISVLFCILTMVLAHVVWIIPLQRSQSRWGRRRVGWQARRKIWGHWGFVLSYFWQIIKLEGALCVVLFLSGNQDAILSSILLNFSILLYLYQPQAALFHTNKSIIV